MQVSVQVSVNSIVMQVSVNSIVMSRLTCPAFAPANTAGASDGRAGPCADAYFVVRLWCSLWTGDVAESRVRFGSVAAEGSNMQTICIPTTIVSYCVANPTHHAHPARTDVHGYAALNPCTAFARRVRRPAGGEKA
jgi:hypothetical protein